MHALFACLPKPGLSDLSHACMHGWPQTYVCIQGGGRGCAWERDQFHGLQQKGYLDMEDVSTPEVPNFSIPSRAMNVSKC